jgi:hypothetical protein
MLNPLSGMSSCMLSLLTFLGLKFNSHRSPMIELHFVSGSLKLMVRSSLPTSDQVTRGMDDLIGFLEEQYELESTVTVDDGSDDDNDSITCGLLPPKKTNKSRMHAEEEVSLLFRE